MMRFLRTVFIVFLLLFTSELCEAQSWDWVAGISNSSMTTAYVNKEGDTYLLHEKSSLTISSSDSIQFSNELITKIGKDGKRVCGFSLPITDKYAYNRFIGICGNEENIYAVLYTYQDVTINGVVFKSTTGRPGNMKNLILVKFDTNCNVVSAKLIGHASQISWMANMQIDKDKNLFFTVAYADSLEIDTMALSSSQSNTSAALFKINEFGNLLWAVDIYKNIRSVQAQVGKIKLDMNENIWIYDNNNYTFQKFNANGKLLLKYYDAKKIWCYSIYFDQDDNLYMAGSFSGTIKINNQLVKSDAGYSGIIVKYDINMAVSWYQNVKSNLYSNIIDIVKDSKKNIYLAFFIPELNKYGNIYFGSLAIENDVFKRHGYIKMDSTGKVLWVKYVLTSRETSGFPYNIYIDDCDNLYTFGMFDNQSGGTTEPIDMATIGMHKLYSQPNNGFYIGKLNQDKLEFEANQSCKKITLKNTSDTTAYSSFEWTLPDGTKHFTRDAYMENKKYPDTVLVSLKGYKKSGCENIFTQKLHLVEMPRSFAKFSIDSFTGCQWVGIKFKDSSYSTGKVGCINCEFRKWDFGDGTTDSIQNPEHIFTKAGNYKITLIYGNPYCTDTFTLEKQITIIEAPKPGFKVSDSVGCAPLTVNITNQSIGEVETYFYTSSDGQSSNQSSPTFIYTKPGKYFIKQMLKGPTGCITKDSAIINVRQSFAENNKPEILTATVTDSNLVKVSWKNNPVAAKYQLTRQSGNISKTYTVNKTDTFYLDEDVSVDKAFYSYTLYGLDSCGNTKAAANIAQTILLQTQEQTKEYNLLRWTAYEKWNNGVQEYKLLYKLDSDFVKLTTLNNAVNIFKDANLYSTEKPVICYKIIATENGENKQISQSNTICLPFLPSLIIPNAFSPNNDLLNDTFFFFFIGIENYTLNIYNRWGEKIFTGTKADKWDGKYHGKTMPDGVYVYTIIAKPYTGKTIYQSGNLQLLR